MLEAATSVIANRSSLRQTAKKYKIHYSTLCRYIKKVKVAREVNAVMPTSGYIYQIYKKNFFLVIEQN